ncbi:hypothetical protein BGX34_008133 [Mortierella sp. NVP85]|nr:hypothetical protein BGX34_008133 [Mortierella sp. NVP85]
MNRGSNANGLPFHSPGGNRRPVFGAVLAHVWRIGPEKFFVLVGLCIISLFALTRLSGDPVSTPRTFVDRSEHEAKSEAEREQVVKEILSTRRSAYRFEDFTEEALVLEENDRLVPATAVLLGWRRLDSLKVIVEYLARYPYIKEIIVWNNNKENKLSKQDFEFDPSYGNLPELQVYNGKDNLHDMSKYMACSLAKYQHCYFQDDDWLNTHMDALYTNFLTSPNLIHTNTLPLIHMEHRRWTFTNPDYRLHSGFSWLGTGSYVPREKAQRLMEQGGNSNLAKDRLRVIDMYFSIWTNQYPYQLVNYLTPLDRKNGWSTDGVSDHWAIVFRNMLDAASRLYSALVANPEVSEKDYFLREEEFPLVKDRHARTSMDHFPDPGEVIYDGDLQTIEEQNQKFFALESPTKEFIDKFAYIHAVDNDPLTCWNSFKVPQVGDSFGLQFVKATLVKKFTIVSSKSLAHLDGKISVLGSDYSGEDWTPCYHTARFPHAHTMVLEVSCSPAPNLPKGLAHNIKIQFVQALEKSVEVCGMELGGMIL